MHLFILVSSLHYLCKTKLNYHKTTIIFFSEQGIIQDERRRTGSLSNIGRVIETIVGFTYGFGKYANIVGIRAFGFFPKIKFSQAFLGAQKIQK